MGEAAAVSRAASASGRLDRWTAGAVAIHLLGNLAHGVPHAVVPVPLAAWQTAFVVVVVVAGPPVGLWLAWRGARRLGGGLVALTGTASFCFGTYFHFLSDTPDNVARVAGTWHSPFLSTAVLLSAAALAVGVGGVAVWSSGG